MNILNLKNTDIENYFTRTCMTYCERCDKEIKNDEWRQHIISDWHLLWGREKYCDICRKKYTTTINRVYSRESERKHLESDSHEKNQETLGF